MIDSFKGEYYFLSNFYSENGISVEHHYQALKAINASDILRIYNCPTAAQAKKEGRKIDKRMDWDEVKLTIMEALLRIKFTDKVLRSKLLSTYPHELVEGNWWGDTFWGVCKSKGENHLGKLLMKIREEIRQESKKLPATLSFGW